MNSNGLTIRYVVRKRQEILRLTTTCPAALSCTRSSESAGGAVRPRPLGADVAAGLRHATWRAAGLVPGFVGLWTSVLLVAVPVAMVVAPLAPTDVELLVDEH